MAVVPDGLSSPACTSAYEKTTSHPRQPGVDAPRTRVLLGCFRFFLISDSADVGGSLSLSLCLRVCGPRALGGGEEEEEGEREEREEEGGGGGWGCLDGAFESKI